MKTTEKFVMYRQINMYRVSYINADGVLKAMKIYAFNRRHAYEKFVEDYEGQFVSVCRY